MTRLVLVGAGHAHLEVLRRFAAGPPPDTELLLVTRRPAALYSGMVPGMIAGHYAPEALTIPLAPLAAAAGASLTIATAAGLDPAARRLALADGGALAYDLISLDVGSAPKLAGAPAIGDRLVPAKPVETLLARLAAAEAHLRPGDTLAVVGGGLAGVELALALAHRFAAADRGVGVALVERDRQIVPSLPAAARRAVLAACARHGVSVREATELGPEGDGFAAVLWATGGAAPPWIAASGLATDRRGFAAIAETLRSTSHPTVFASGDVASLAAAPYPKAGVFAVRQGPTLAENLRRALAGRPPRPWRPQRHWLSLIATGPRHAIATRNGLTVQGAWVWAWKDRIDRGFVARHRRQTGPNRP